MKIFGTFILFTALLYGCSYITEPDEDKDLYKLCIMDADGTNVQGVLKTEVERFVSGISYPMFTLDDTHIIFNYGRSITPIESPVWKSLSNVYPNGPYPSLSPDGVRIVFSTNLSPSLRLVNLNTMNTAILSTPGFGQTTSPVFTDNGDSIIIRTYSAPDRLSQYRIMDRDGTYSRQLLANPFTGDNWNVYHFIVNHNKTDLYFIHGTDTTGDVYRYQINAGTVHVMINHVSTQDRAELSLSSDERFLIARNAGYTVGFKWRDLLSNQVYACFDASFSSLGPDPSHALVVKGYDMFTMDLTSGTTQYLGKGLYPRISHDGTKIVFVTKKHIDGD